MIYKVHVIVDGESVGYSYFSNKKDALKHYKSYNNRLVKADPDDCWTDDTYYEASIQSFKTPKTKQDVISLLNIHGGHNNNG